MRAEDLQMLSPQRVTLTGKRVRDLFVFIPFGAWIVNGDWLGDGYDLWSGSVELSADYFLPRSDKALGSFLKTATLNVRVLSELNWLGGGQSDGGKTTRRREKLL